MCSIDESCKRIRKTKPSIAIPYIHPNREHLDERAIYGFIIYLVCFPAFGLYVIWAYIPHEWLNLIGITYLPSKHWSVTAPISLLILCISGLFAYIWNNRSLMQPLTSIYQIRDSLSMYARNSTDSYVTDQQSSNSNVSKPVELLRPLSIIPPVYDLDHIWVTSELYLKTNKITTSSIIDHNIVKY
uniref:Putative phosphatidylinositol N-acetylglucosaminyltransferase subunit P n=1 Tax=Schistosoma mansoni TaxID=6183 RepID=A0A3Q0KRS8_SCHMA